MPAGWEKCLRTRDVAAVMKPALYILGSNGQQRLAYRLLHGFIVSHGPAFPKTAVDALGHPQVLTIEFSPFA